MNRDPRQPNESTNPAAPDQSQPDDAANQTNEKHGRIKRRQNNPEKDVSRGSEPARHYRG